MRPKRSTRHGEISRKARERSEIGEPGGGAGRRDEVGPTGVYPYSSDKRPNGAAELRSIGDWMRGDRRFELETRDSPPESA